MTEVDINQADKATKHAVNWRGQSGRYYPLVEEQLDSFALEGDDLYLVAKGTKASWIGTALDIIGDQASRAQFREAMITASSVLRFQAPEDDVERMRMICDIEAGTLAGALSLVT